jgi:acyl-CoA thioester hydrolase
MVRAFCDLWATKLDETDVSEPRVVDSQIRVRYAETDAEGVVYYANHFVYMEVGRVNYLRALGFDPGHWNHSDWGIVVVEASCRYHSPARFDDLLIVRTWPEDVRRTSFAFVYEIVHAADGRSIAHARTVQVAVDLGSMRPIRLPPEVRDMLSAAATADGR